MKILSLSASNFMALGEGVRLRLDGRGLNVIQGVNNEDSSATSNGSGKSSIMDALCWTLYGTTAREEKGDGVINEKVGKNTVCSVEIANGETAYRITRHRKHKTHKNQLHIEAFSPASAMLPGATGTRLDKGTEAESQVVLESILGCSYSVFVAAVYSGQEAMPDLPRKTDRELKSLIEEAAGLQRIEAAYRVARDRLGDRKSAVQDLQGRIDSALLMQSRASTDLTLKTAQRLEWESGRADRVAAAEEALKQAIVERDAFKATADIRSVGAGPLAEARKKLQAALGSHNEARRLADEAARQADELDRKVNRASAGMVAKEIEAVNKKIAGAAEHMGQPCVECGKPHTKEELDAYLAIQNRARTELLGRAAMVAEQVRAQVQAVAAQREVAAALLAKVPDVSETSRQLTLVNERQLAIQKALDDLRAAEAKVTARSDGLAAIRAMPNPHDSAIETLTAQHKDATEKLAGLRAGLEEAMARQATAEAIVKIFGPAGVRAQILDTVTPYLNSRTAHYLSVLSDGGITATWTTLTRAASGDLKEKFGIEVTNARGGKRFSALSGGEKRKVRLACNLALQDLVASRAANPIELWIGDEVDDAMDAAGLERLMTVLEGKARERGTVLVISHNSLTDWCDQITTVTKSASGLAHVEGALTEE